MSRPVVRLAGQPVRDFHCGVHALDDYLRRFAVGNDALGIGRVWLLLRGDADPREWPEILGYFTLSMAQVPAEAARSATGERLPGYPTPVALIGRLARDERARGGGVGDALLGAALLKVLEADDRVACFGVVVDAKDQAAQAFYERAGFQVLVEGDFPRRCFLPMATLRSATR